ncbi:delta-sarcoglycan isoform X1 [Tachysurus ichikawai]
MINDAHLLLPDVSLESPTRSLYMEAPKGVQIQAEAGDIQATCRSDLRLESKDGETSAALDPICCLGLLGALSSTLRLPYINGNYCTGDNPRPNIWRELITS